MSDAPPFVVRSTATVVEAWAVERLAPDPDGWQVAFRAALRDGIGQLVGPPGRSLACSYESADDRPCDVGDVLVQRVGTAAFVHLAVDGLILERSPLRPLPPPAPLAGQAEHYHRYEVTGRREPSHWTPGALIAAFTSAPIERPVSAAAIRLALRDGRIDIRRPSSEGHLCLRATLDLPVLSRSSLYAAMRPVVAGVVSALGELEGLDARWDPADERLVAVDLRARIDEQLLVSGELYEAKPL